MMILFLVKRKKIRIAGPLFAKKSELWYALFNLPTLDCMQLAILPEKRGSGDAEVEIISQPLDKEADSVKLPMPADVKMKKKLLGRPVCVEKIEEVPVIR